MSDADKEARSSPAVRLYMLFCFAGLLAMVPVLLLKGMDLWCIFPLILGALSLMAHWRSGPVFVLLSLAMLIPLRARGLDPITCLQLLLDFGRPPLSGLGFVPATPFLDVLLSLCVLIYVAGHYRLQALVHHVVPPDTRSQLPLGRGKASPRVEPFNPRRTPQSLTNKEIPLLTAAALISALAGEYAWDYFHQRKPGLGMSAVGWQTLLFIWTSALLLFVAWSAFGYLARTRATPAESQLYLQDQLWRETRREQSRLSRWLAWAHWRGRRRQEEVR